MLDLADERPRSRRRSCVRLLPDRLGRRRVLLDTIELLDLCYGQLVEVTVTPQSSIEDELLEVVAAAVPVADELSEDLAEAIRPLAAFDDEALWRAARDRFPSDAAERLESLGQKRQREGLTAAETQEAATLIRQYERVTLVRARAAALLKRRGHDVASLLTAR